MVVIDRQGFWFQNIKTAANVYILLAVLSGALFYFVDSLRLSEVCLSVFKGVLLVLALYFTIISALLTKAIYDDMLKRKKAKIG